VLLWSRQLTTAEGRTALQVAVRSLVEDRPEVLTAALAASDGTVVRQALRLVRRLKATSTIDTIAKLEKHQDTSVRASASATLAALNTPAAFRKLTRFLSDDDEHVRVFVLEALAHVSFKGALSSLQRMISAEDIEERGLAEKRALFEAYGAVAGSAGVTILAPMLKDSGGLFRKGGSSDTRACAAVALGLIGTPGARAALEKGLRDRDPVVSNAARRALRGD
jgi:HEAT repeat protein